jgi:predicted PurR-regulated permease PerM
LLIAPGPLLMRILPGTLLAHFLTQPATVFQRHIAPARRAHIATNLTLLLPVFAHLLSHLAPIVRWQIAPICLRPNTAGRA